MPLCLLLFFGLIGERQQILALRLSLLAKLISKEYKTRFRSIDIEKIIQRFATKKRTS
jgi:hypothetical protein